MNAPFASGSNAPDAMVVIPCSMGTLGRIAHGYSEDVLLRAADVVLKEKKKLILVPRETPLNLVHVKNFELLLLAGAVILPANPSFYTHPQTVEQVVDTVVARVLDHLGVEDKLVERWGFERGGERGEDGGWRIEGGKNQGAGVEMRSEKLRIEDCGWNWEGRMKTLTTRIRGRKWLL